MTRLDPAPARRREQIIGAVVVVVGVAVLVLSIVALVAAGSGPGSDVAGPAVTLPGGSGTASPTGAATSPSSTGSPAGSGTPTTSTSSSATTSPPNSPTSAIGSQPLVVLNNTSESGLAQTAAATFTEGGWTVTDTANWSQSTISTCAYYDASVAGAEAAAQALMQQFPAIKRAVAKYGALPAGPVVVVLTNDYTAQ